MAGTDAKETYIKRMEYLREHPGRCRLLHRMNRIFEAAVFAAYVLLLAWFLLRKDALLARAVIVPLDGFLILSVFRWLIDKKRPYEVYGVPPAIKKETKGKSFPSRHIFSAFMIAMTYICLSPWPLAGIALLLAGALLAWIRVASGVHFPADVLAGAACGVAAGLIGFVLF